MIPNRISDAITRFGKETEVRVTIYALRRYYAIMLYHTAGTDIQTVRRLIRQVDVFTTLKYYVDAYDQGPVCIGEAHRAHRPDSEQTSWEGVR